MEKKPCIICQTDGAYYRYQENRIIVVLCPKCGNFKITFMFEHFGIYNEEKKDIYKIQGVLRERSENGSYITLTRSVTDVDIEKNIFNIKTLLASKKIPEMPEDKALNLLYYAKRLTGDDFGKFISFDLVNDYPLAYVKDTRTFGAILNLLKEKGYIDHLTTRGALRLTNEGYKAATISPTYQEISEHQGLEDKKDFFICHASEDKEKVARPLVAKLIKNKITVWYDKGEILMGDYLIRKINEGLRISKYVIVILSIISISKEWPTFEFETMLTKEINSGQIKVLPIIVGSEIEKKKILEAYPILEGKYHAHWDTEGEDVIVGKLLHRLKSS